MAKPFVHLELTTADLAKSKEFYGKLFGWTYTDNIMGPDVIYSTFKPDSGPGGALFTMPGAPNAWLAYVDVDEINAATEKAKALGATIVRGPLEVPGHGWFTVLIDPTGASIALWQAKSV
jgi:predicted enzyme related to lactoylglutathione lyase